MQQVNLLAAELKPREQPLLVRQVLVLWLAFGGILILITLWQSASWWGLSQDAVLARQQVDQLRQENAQLAEAVKLEPARLRQELAELQSQFEHNAALVDALLASRQHGFSLYLTELSAARVRGLWLSDIHVQHSPGIYLQLQGSALDPVHIPVFLQNLAVQSMFSGRQFEHFDVVVDDQSQVSTFSIASAAPEA